MRIKIVIIISIGLASFIYNFINGDLLFLIKQTDYISIINPHFGIKGDDSYIGIIFDFIISSSFNVNIKDITSFFKIFGG